MTDEKWFIKDEDGQYGEGILIDEYQGSWFLVSARQKNDGKVWMEWCFPQMRDGSKKPMDKSFPWKIKLGESDKEAGAKLRELADRIDPPEPYVLDKEAPF